MLELKPDSESKEWLLGDNFLRGYYQVYDMLNEKVGMSGSGISAGEKVVLEDPKDHETKAATTNTSSGDESEGSKNAGRFDPLDFSLTSSWIFWGIMAFLLIVIIWVCAICCKKKKEGDVDQQELQRQQEAYR